MQDALVAPREATTVELLDKARLPNGSNSFFRQLDHMIATLCNEEFAALYALTRDLVVAVDGVEESASQQPTAVVIQMYSNLKAAIFSRYRTLSELLGVGLVREAQKQRLNCMLETSGRDVAMFHYVDHFFGRPDDEININGKRPNPAENPPVYRKLALHFTINDLQHAKDSVDRRMKEEIQAGIEALKHGDVFAIINANAGGPYGSEVLEGVQADSNRVWNEDVMAKGGVGQDWYKATIQINAHETKPWTAQAVKPDGSMGQEFIFKRD